MSDDRGQIGPHLCQGTKLPRVRPFAGEQRGALQGKMPLRGNVLNLRDSDCRAAGVARHRSGQVDPDGVAALVEVPLLQLVGVDLASRQTRSERDVILQVVGVGDVVRGLV